jgi:hypothetical protein
VAEYPSYKLTIVYLLCLYYFVRIDLGVVRSNQNVSMMEVDDQERQERQRQEEIARQHQAELVQEELRAAQEQVKKYARRYLYLTF